MFLTINIKRLLSSPMFQHRVTSARQIGYRNFLHLFRVLVLTWGGFHISCKRENILKKPFPKIPTAGAELGLGTGAGRKNTGQQTESDLLELDSVLIRVSLSFSNMFPANLVQATFQQVRHHAARSDTKPAAFKRKLNASFICFCFVLLFFFYGQQYRTSSQYIVKPKPTVSQSESTTRRALIYGIQDDNGTDIQNFALDLTPPPDVLIRTREGTSDGMNVLGIVIFSATMGTENPELFLSIYRCKWERF